MTRRIAFLMLGGMVTTALLTLIVIPVIYFVWIGRGLLKVSTEPIKIEKTVRIN